MALSANGETDEAIAVAESAVATSKPLAPAHASALANLADLELRHGRDTEQALARASEAYALLEKLGGLEDTESLVRVAYAEALEADVIRSTATRKAIERKNFMNVVPP